MSSKKVFFGMIALLLLLAAAATALVVYGDIFMNKESAKLVDQRLESHLLDEQQAALTRANQDIEQYEDLEKTVQAVVPQDKDQARAVREIINIAAKSGIKISSIDFPSSSLGEKQKKSASDNPEAPTPKSESKSSPVSQATPVDGINGVYSLEMNIVPDSNQPVSYYKFLEFLSRLENNRRTAQVTSVRIEPVGDSSTNPSVTFSLTINIFVKP